MDQKSLNRLREHFTAEDGTFMMTVHEGVWDKKSFDEMCELMTSYCRETEKSDQLDRQMAQSFYDIPSWIRNKYEKDAICFEFSHEYFEACIHRLEDLREWYFRGSCPYMDGVLRPLPKE